jgi:hypothetical protein
MGYGNLNNVEIKTPNLGAGIHKITEIEVIKEDFLPKKFDAETASPSDYLKRLKIIFKNSSGKFEHNSLEPKEFKEDGTKNALFPKTFLEIKYIYSKIKGVEFSMANVIADSWDELCDFAIKELTKKDLNFELKIIPNKGLDGKFYPSIITYAPKGGVGQWTMGWLANLEKEAPIVLTGSEKDAIEAYNKTVSKSKELTDSAETIEEIPF